MEPAATFRFRRLPRGWKWIVAWAVVAGIDHVVSDWRWGLVFLAAVGIGTWHYWRSHKKHGFIRLDEDEMSFGGKDVIPKWQIGEVSPTPVGLTVVWMQDGVPRYTEIAQTLFEDKDWPGLVEALREWVGGSVVAGLIGDAGARKWRSLSAGAGKEVGREASLRGGKKWWGAGRLEANGPWAA